jgi:translation initiation factor RLI1
MQQLFTATFNKIIELRSEILSQTSTTLLELIPLNGAEELGAHTLLGNAYRKDKNPINLAIEKYLAKKDGWKNGRILNYIASSNDQRKHSTSKVRFDDGIQGIISFGDPEPHLDRVLAAAQAAAAHDFIMRLPMGYETKIGESGLAISGGQKQRIAIARAIYNNPPILIFDEATSALDTESERAIQNNLGRIMAGRTTIAIAHRLSTIREADSIIVLEKGSVAEIGSHDELMAQRGLYFYLSSQQMGVSG